MHAFLKMRHNSCLPPPPCKSVPAHWFTWSWKSPGAFANFHCLRLPAVPFSLGKDIVSTDKHERTREAWQIQSSVGTVRKKGQCVFNEPCVIFFAVRVWDCIHIKVASKYHFQLLKLDLTNICLYFTVCAHFT